MKKLLLLIGALLFCASLAYATSVRVPQSDSTGTLLDSAGSSGTTNIGQCGVRLTLTSGLPVTTADVTGATTIYATPFQGGQCAFYDGSATWTTLTFSETSIALGTITSGLPYDVFCYNNSGTMACDAPLAWTNGTTRATALALQNGVYVKSGATTRRYFGTFYTTATTTTEDSVSKRYVWNYYNRRPRPLQRFETTVAWTQTNGSFRQANSSTANQVHVVVGVLEDPVSMMVCAGANNPTNADVGVVAIGEDSTTTPLAGSQIGRTSNAIAASLGQVGNTSAIFNGFPSSVGRHYYAWLEALPSATSTVSWYGAASASPETMRYGMTGMVWG